MTLSLDTLNPDDFDALDAILDEVRSRFDETPQWEFCEGFMAALIACRRTIPATEYFDALLDTDSDAMTTATTAEQPTQPFASAQQRDQFMALWQRRWTQVQAELDADVDRLDDERAYSPEVLDVRGAIAALPAAERAGIEGDPLPAFGQVWALGFMYAVECWPEDWDAPRDKEARKILDDALQSIVALTEDDTAPPTIAVFTEDGPPSVSANRFDAFAAAVWAVYDLRAMWQHIGPRIATVYKADTPGRNDPCHCGSGLKFKKCHGA